MNKYQGEGVMSAKKDSLVGVKDLKEKRVSVIGVVGMFYAICCAGAYGIEEMIPEVGPGLTMVMLIALPLLWALPYSYICAELGSARPVEGGALLWVKEALGEYWGGIMLWMNFLWGLIANTVYVVLAISYLGHLIDLGALVPGISAGTMEFILKVVLIIIFYIINVLGIKEVSTVSTVLSILVVIAFAVVTVAGFTNWNQNPIEPFMADTYDGDIFRTIGGGLAIGIWMYSGFDELSTVAGEIENSKKIIPRALMIVIPLMALTYILPTLAGLASIGDWENWTTDIYGVGYTEVLFAYAPHFVAVAFIVVAILGQCSIFNMCLTTASRATLVLADEKFGPKILARLSKRRSTPIVALTLVIIVTILLVNFDFIFLVVIDTTFCLLVSSIVAVSAYILKRRIPAEEVPFKIPGGKPVHTLCVVLTLFMCLTTLLLDGSDYFFGGMLVAIALPIIYVIVKKAFKGFTNREPDFYPIDPRTGLGFGDITRIGRTYIGTGIVAIAARFFLSWYEGTGWLTYDGVGDSWWYFPGDYDMTFGFEEFPSLLNAITIGGIIITAVGIVCIFIGKKLSNELHKAI
jgi:amino acid transporter